MPGAQVTRCQAHVLVQRALIGLLDVLDCAGTNQQTRFTLSRVPHGMSALPRNFRDAENAGEL